MKKSLADLGNEKKRVPRSRTKQLTPKQEKAKKKLKSIQYA